MHLEYPPAPERPSRKGKERDPSHQQREAQVTDLDEKIIALRRKNAGCVAFPPPPPPKWPTQLFISYLPDPSGHGIGQSETGSGESRQILPHRAHLLSRRPRVAQSGPPSCLPFHLRLAMRPRRRGNLPGSFRGLSLKQITKTFHAGSRSPLLPTPPVSHNHPIAKAHPSCTTQMSTLFLPEEQPSLSSFQIPLGAHMFMFHGILPPNSEKTVAAALGSFSTTGKTIPCGSLSKPVLQVKLPIPVPPPPPNPLESISQPRRHRHMLRP